MVIDGSNGITFPSTTVQGDAVSVIGLGGSAQSWQNVTASRAGNTTYYNTKGRPIVVAISQVSSGTQNFYINGVQVTQNQTSSTTSSCFNYVIPAGASYQSSSVGSFWFELS